MISEVGEVIILTLFTVAIGILILRRKLKENLKIIGFLTGFILFVDELCDAWHSVWTHTS